MATETAASSSWMRFARSPSARPTSCSPTLTPTPTGRAGCPAGDEPIEELVEAMVNTSSRPTRVIEDLGLPTRSNAARHHDEPRTLLLVFLDSVGTDLGRPGSSLGLDEGTRGEVDVTEKHVGDGGPPFLDHDDQIVLW